MLHVRKHGISESGRTTWAISPTLPLPGSHAESIGLDQSLSSLLTVVEPCIYLFPTPRVFQLILVICPLTSLWLPADFWWADHTSLGCSPISNETVRNRWSTHFGCRLSVGIYQFDRLQKCASFFSISPQCLWETISKQKWPQMKEELKLLIIGLLYMMAFATLQKPINKLLVLGWGSHQEKKRRKHESKMSDGVITWEVTHHSQQVLH